MENPNLIKPKYSVIVLIYHRTPELVQMARDCVASVKNSSQDYELIIVDNGSTERYPWENECDTYVRLSENKGISRGWNTGLRLARGKYVCILGDDTIVHTGYLEELQKAMDMPQCGVANIHVQHLPHGVGIVESIKWFSGACFMLKQKTIEKVGYFDENIWPANWEDTDYWIRVLQAGLKLYKNHHITIQHKEGQTLHAKDISAYFEQNRAYIIKKHGFDPQPIFYGMESFPKSANIPL